MIISLLLFLLQILRDKKWQKYLYNENGMPQLLLGEN